MIVGTAGHIDHGKTLLVKALTGVTTDRLKEEQARGISIDLGFAYIPVPESATEARQDGDILGFVDVPGHERFVHTMLAGAAGIDFALLVVAADDGVMPQTREHLQILDLLGISEGLVALNKVDLVDPARQAKVEDEIRALLLGTTLEGADIYPVSAARNGGIAEIKARLLDEAASRPERPFRGAFRMPIDRSFSLKGAGTVVTGAVRSGAIHTGDKVRVLPSGEEVRVRTLHSQGRVSETGQAGQRCALNLVGIEKEALHRGDWLVDPATTAVTARFDAELRLLATEEKAVRTWSPVHLHVGTSRVPARIVMIAGDRLEPGDMAPVQIVAERPLPLVFGDLFVIRDVSADRTMGGGHVIDPKAPQRRRRTAERQAVRAALSLRDPAEALDSLLALPPGIADLSGFIADRGLSGPEAEEVIELVEPEMVTLGGRQFAARADALATLSEAVEPKLAAFHAEHPELPGMPFEMLRIAMEPRLGRPFFDAAMAMLIRSGALAASTGALRLPSHSSSIGAADQVLWDRVLLVLEEHRFQPPPVREIAEALRQPLTNVRKLCKTMARLGTLVEVEKDRFFLTKALRDFGELAHEIARTSPGHSFTAAAFRDRAGCGRAIAIQVLEYFDRRGITGRRGDKRIVGKKPSVVFGGAPVI